MSLEITEPAVLGKLVEGFGIFATDPAPFVWHTITLDPSIADKNIEIHMYNNTNGFFGFRVRQLDDFGNPIGGGIQLLVGKKTTVSKWTKANKNAQIQIITGAGSSLFKHMNTIK